MADRNVAEALSMLVDKMDPKDIWDDDIDAPVDDDLAHLSFELDEHGNYVRLKGHLKKLIRVGKPKPNVYQRAELFHETVIETIMDAWQRCSQMYCRLYAGFPYVGIYVDYDKLGGFSQKSKRDEQKGTIIECINAGRISTLMTPGCLDSHVFVFLPNASTLAAIGEFPLLAEATYALCFVARNGDVELTDLDISYESIASMILKDLSIQDLIVSALEGYDPNADLLDAPTIEEIREMEAMAEEETKSEEKASETFEDDDDFDDLEDDGDSDMEEEPGSEAESDTEASEDDIDADFADAWADDDEEESEEEDDLVGFEELSDEDAE